MALIWCCLPNEIALQDDQTSNQLNCDKMPKNIFNSLRQKCSAEIFTATLFDQFTLFGLKFVLFLLRPDRKILFDALVQRVFIYQTYDGYRSDTRVTDGLLLSLNDLLNAFSIWRWRWRHNSTWFRVWRSFWEIFMIFLENPIFWSESCFLWVFWKECFKIVCTIFPKRKSFTTFDEKTISWMSVEWRKKSKMRPTSRWTAFKQLIRAKFRRIRRKWQHSIAHTHSNEHWFCAHIYIEPAETKAVTNNNIECEETKKQ